MVVEARPEVCEECRFDQAAYGWDDLNGSLRGLARRFRWSVEGIDRETLNTRPGPDVWSPLEYARHMRGVLALWRLVVQMTLEGHDAVDGDAPPGADPADTVPDLDPDLAVELLMSEVAEFQHLVAGLDAGQRSAHMRVNGERCDVEWQVTHAVHDCQHHLADIGRGLVALGAGSPPSTGWIDHLHSSDGGVPKHQIGEARIGYRGVEGDRQAVRRHHGRVWQALCLWSTEVIDSLADEGHPISHGNAGENVTIGGLDWSTLRPGTRIALGRGDDEVLIELTAWAEPCASNTPWFTLGDFRRMDHDRHPGTSRAYASVLRDGVVRPGDPVRVEPRG